MFSIGDLATFQLPKTCDFKYPTNLCSFRFWWFTFICEDSRVKVPDSLSVCLTEPTADDSELIFLQPFFVIIVVMPFAGRDIYVSLFTHVKLNLRVNRRNIKQECIPVGCVPSATVAVCGQNDRRLWKHYLAATMLRMVNMNKQECIPVGCVPPDSVVIGGGVCLQRGVSA